MGPGRRLESAAGVAAGDLEGPRKSARSVKPYNGVS
jgi:hypothetical protein